MNSVRFCAPIPDHWLSFPRGVRSLPVYTQSFQQAPEPNKPRPAFQGGATPDPQPRHPTTASSPRLLTLSSTFAYYFGRENFGPSSRLGPVSLQIRGRPPCSPRPAARSQARPPLPSPPRPLARSLHLLPLPSSPRRPRWPSCFRAARSLPNLRVSKPRGRTGPLPAAAPPLPDPPPLVSPPTVSPQGAPGTRVQGAGAGRSVSPARLSLALGGHGLAMLMGGARAAACSLLILAGTQEPEQAFRDAGIRQRKS